MYLSKVHQSRSRINWRTTTDTRLQCTRGTEIREEPAGTAEPRNTINKRARYSEFTRGRLRGQRPSLEQLRGPHRYIAVSLQRTLRAAALFSILLFKLIDFIGKATVLIDVFHINLSTVGSRLCIKVACVFVLFVLDPRLFF